MTRLARVVAVSLTLVALAGCGAEPAEPSPRAVTSAEAQVLAVSRFLNFDARTRPFETTYTLSGVDVTMRGWVDYVAELGYASVSGEFGTEAVLWTDSSIGAIPRDAGADGYPVLPIPTLDDPEWQIEALDAGSSALGALVATISALGSDRPDNPLLLQQSGALWLRTDVIGDTAVTVFGAPPSDAPVTDSGPPDVEAVTLRLWLDADGLLRRAEVFVNDGWTSVDFPDIPGPELSIPERTG
ncbi:hypothetical protein [Pseudolysinimonas sp.]|uniref:hypothetical protein n=1 Tax=Pseudolysinimonas sp. TaxID=2680009 RepID=UPI00286A1274|nr:hypothetical protein [Pseudolysinimonas sp.]